MKTPQNMTRYFVKTIIRLIFETIANILSLLFPPQRSRLPPIDDKLLLKSALELSSEIKLGKLTSEQVVEAYIRRIRCVNPLINATVDDSFDTALKRAREIDRRLSNARKQVEGGGKHSEDSLMRQPLVGIPFSIKETISLAGASFTAGLKSRSSKQAATTSPVIQQLIDAGLVPIASTNTPCMSLWFDSYNLVHGRTNNPYDLSRIPGGSSGGEAALISAAGSLLGVGSDLAGSIRIPAHFCGIFGHKPTALAVTTRGMYPVCRDEQELMRGLGPMTRYACDMLPMLDAMITNPIARERMNLRERVDLRKIKVFYCEDINDPLVSRCDSDIINAIRAAVQHFKSTYNIQCQNVTLDEFRYGLPLWSAEYEGGRILMPEHPDGFEAFSVPLELLKCLVGMSDYPFNTIFCAAVEKLGASAGSDKHKYLKSKAKQLRSRFEQLVGDNGVLLLPTHPHPAPQHHTTVFKFLNCAYTAVCNVLHAPITQCPMGKSTRDGLPIGVQIIAKPYNDRITLAVANELGKTFGGWQAPSQVLVDKQQSALLEC